MCHNWKNGAILENWVTVGKMGQSCKQGGGGVTFGKMGQTLKVGSHLEKWVTLKKVGHI